MTSISKTKISSTVSVDKGHICHFSYQPTVIGEQYSSGHLISDSGAELERQEERGECLGGPRQARLHPPSRI
jgi:hypothetical protein